MPELAIPDEATYQTIIAPLLSSTDISDASLWSGRRVSVVASSLLLGGIPGAILAGAYCSHQKEKQRERDVQYISEKNK